MNQGNLASSNFSGKLVGKTSDKITLMIFKDNEAARSFQISLKWLTQSMILISFILVGSGISLLAAFQFYRIAVKTDPSHVQDLEEELTAVKLQLKSLESISTGGPVHASSNASHSGATESSANGAQNGLGNGNHSAMNPPLLLFPAPVVVSHPTVAVPFTIEGLSATWSMTQRGVSKTLKVRFAIQYQKNDQGSQQGRILVLARGSAGLFTYPPDAINPPGQEGVIAVDKGEFFSVSRFRQVNADFGPIPVGFDLANVEIFIFSKEGQILTYQKVAVEKAAGTPTSRSVAITGNAALVGDEGAGLSHTAESSETRNSTKDGAPRNSQATSDQKTSALIAPIVSTNPPLEEASNFEARENVIGFPTSSESNSTEAVAPEDKFQ